MEKKTPKPEGRFAEVIRKGKEARAKMKKQEPRKEEISAEQLMREVKEEK